jgi:AraC-like DNA-binding protein
MSGVQVYSQPGAESVDAGSRGSPLTRTRLPRLLLRRLQELDVDLAAFSQRCGLPPGVAEQEEVVLSLAALERTFAAAEELLGDASLGVHMALHFERGSFGLLEYTFRHAPTLREALRRVARYVGLTNDLVQMAFTEERGGGRIAHWMTGYPSCLGRQPNEYFMVLLVLQMRELTGTQVVPEQVQFAHPCAAAADALCDALGSRRITFGTEVNAIHLSPATLATPLREADATLLSILDGVASAKLSTSPPAKDFLQQVRRAIREQLDGALPRMPAVAASFRMSERTFQRRLGEEGASYQGLVDSVRQELARHHVAGEKLSFGEIAYLLGYAELSAFLRAFKRWVGMTPQQFRVKALAEAAAEGSRSPRTGRST